MQRQKRKRKRHQIEDSGTMSLIRHINARDVTGDTPLFYACQRGLTVQTVEDLIQRGADVTLRRGTKQRGDTVLHLACRLGHMDIVKLLLKQPNIDPNALGKHGVRPLDIAFRHCPYRGAHMPLALLLIRSGANVVAQADTVLHLACHIGTMDLVKVLLNEMKADPNALGKHGVTPLDIALEQGHTSIAFSLMRAGANVVAGFALYRR